MTRKPKNVHATMDAFLRRLATTSKNQRAKLLTIVKYQEELGPEWCTKVMASLDDIIDGYQSLRAALVKNAAEPVPEQMTRSIGASTMFGTDE